MSEQQQPIEAQGLIRAGRTAEATLERVNGILDKVEPLVARLAKDGPQILDNLLAATSLGADVANAVKKRIEKWL